jgi:hypothetical protein
MSKSSFEGWLAERPRWMQTAAARLLGSQHPLEDKDINALADLCLAEASKNPVAAFEAVPAGAFTAAVASLNVRLAKIEKVNGVNAIRQWGATMTTSGVATFILAGSEESEAA